MNLIFVFGSNLAGRHGKGAALFAKQFHGAIYGVGEGLQGNSYAIPTKDAKLRSRPLPDISFSVLEFLNFATNHPKLTFQVTAIGCGLAGYSPEQIAPMFQAIQPVPSNVILPKEFIS
jgi:hypothetical protein